MGVLPNHQSLEGRAGTIQSLQSAARAFSPQPLMVLPVGQLGPEVDKGFSLLLGEKHISMQSKSPDMLVYLFARWNA